MQITTEGRVGSKRWFSVWGVEKANVYRFDED